MDAWDAVRVLADSESLTAGSAVTADISELTNPTVLVTLEDLEGEADDTVTIRVQGEAATYQVDERTISATDGSDDYTVDVPHGDTLEFESANGVTYSAEVRAGV